jgi:hypothetical protein
MCENLILNPCKITRFWQQWCNPRVINQTHIYVKFFPILIVVEPTTVFIYIPVDFSLTSQNIIATYGSKYSFYGKFVFLIALLHNSVLLNVYTHIPIYWCLHCDQPKLKITIHIR